MQPVNYNRPGRSARSVVLTAHAGAQMPEMVTEWGSKRPLAVA